MRRALTLKETAEVLHKAPETWRKGWRAYCRQYGFPQPLPGRRHNWRPEEVEAWLERRDRTLNLGTGRNPLPAANDPFAPTVNDNPMRGLSPARLTRERAELAQLMKG